MPAPSKGPRLGGSPQHERLILRNLTQSLFEHGKITTTEAKAKRLRPHAEKLITTAKRGDLHARREALKVIRDKNVVHKLFAEIGPSFATREGGYTRIIKTAPRKGDNAPMAIIELITEETVSAAASRTTRRAARTRTAGSAPLVSSQAAPKQAEQAKDEAPAEGADLDEVTETTDGAGSHVAESGVVDADVVEVEPTAAVDEAPVAEAAADETPEAK